MYSLCKFYMSKTDLRVLFDRIISMYVPTVIVGKFDFLFLILSFFARSILFICCFKK